MMNEFKKWEFDLDKIKWILYPNIDDISEELLDSIVMKEPSYSNGFLVDPGITRRRKGMVCCTYKHYLSLKDIVENNYDYGVIIEDNIYFTGKIPELVDKYIDQLNKHYGEWDILFDANWTSYIEGTIQPGILVYPKSNDITQQCHGSTKTATFYLVKKECAKKLIEHYIPFNNAPDWWMNDLFRKLNIKSFWVEPSFVRVQDKHISTTGIL
jgi:GR25 family glycosyltransferase involved in LPS biosynthesis